MLLLSTDMSSSGTKVLWVNTGMKLLVQNDRRNLLMHVLVNMLSLFVHPRKFRSVNAITVSFVTFADTQIGSRKFVNADPWASASLPEETRTPMAINPSVLEAKMPEKLKLVRNAPTYITRTWLRWSFRKVAERRKATSDSGEGHVSRRRRANGQNGDGLTSTTSEILFPVTNMSY